MSILEQILIEELDRNNRFIDLAEKEISELPSGYISEKNINGKNYSYHQWREGEKIKSQYIKNKDIDKLSKKISRRKELMEAVSIAKKENKRIERALK